MSIYRAIAGMTDAVYPLTMDALSSAVDPDYLGYLDEVLDTAITPERERQTYDECISFIRKKMLADRVEDLSSQIEMGEGILSEEEANKLMTELVEIQRKING